MALLANISLRRGLALLVAILFVLTAGTLVTVKVTTNTLLDSAATATARDWARFIAANVSDLEHIADGEQPSVASLAFFQATRKAGKVFRYVIYNPEGYSQLVSDRDRIALVDLSELNSEAARAGRSGLPVVDIKTGHAADLPAYFAEAFIPVMAGERIAAVVGAFVDQTAQRDEIYFDFLLAALALCVLTGLSFGVPAVAWYRRTREKQEADRRIRFLAHHDALTELVNRARLIERMESSLAVLPAGSMLAVHFIDVDRFKEINDVFGHDGGDFLLKSLASRLKNVTRFDDTVARLGGDEFVVLQRGIVDRDQAGDLAERIKTALSTPMTFKEQHIGTSVSVGVALAPRDGSDPERLLKCADLALYTSKTQGRDRICFFEPEMDAALQARLALEKAVRDAVSANAFVLHYQPVFEIADQHLIGFEALIRMPAADGTMIPPGVFIPVAEEIRLIDKIGIWVLREACRTAKTWPEPLTVAVNLSPAQFEGGRISAIVADALRQSGLPPHRLELEITETLLLGDTETNMRELRRLKDMGVSIVMDDFGTGYSSLSYLWRFPFNKIKIDRSFMQGFDKTGRDAETVVKTIIALGRELNMRVTVEGVETPKQVAFLDGADADQVQGFYFGRPVPATEINVELLKRVTGTSPRLAAAAERDGRLRLAGAAEG